MTIKRQLQIFTFFTLMFILTVGLILFATTRRVNESLEGDELAADIAQGIVQQNNLTSDYLLYGGARSQAQWQTKYQSLRESLISASARIEGSEESSILQQLIDSHEDMRTIFLDLLNVTEISSNREDSIVYKELENSLTANMSLKSQAMLSFAFQLAQFSRADVQEAQNLAAKLVGTLILLFAALSFSSLLYVNKRILKPIVKLEQGTEIIGAGNLDHRVGSAVKVLGVSGFGQFWVREIGVKKLLV